MEAEGAVVHVVRNDYSDPIHWEEYDKVVLSPGPGLPSESGKLMHFIDEMMGNHKPVLGVCLGMQALAEYFGGGLYNLDAVSHGVSVNCQLEQSSRLLKGLPSSIKVGLYHSWAVQEPLPNGFIAVAKSESGVVMAMEHNDLPIYGVQFHPESVLTPRGRDILKQFMDL